MKEKLERKESKGKTYVIPVRQIVANTNPRNPLSPELQKQGWDVFKGPENHPGLWHFAVSNDPEKRKFFVETMQQYDPEFVQWASTFLSQGQLQDIEVRDNGRKGDEPNTYTLIFGCRRCLAILYNWCVLGKPAEPVVNAKLAKGNNVSCLYRAVTENWRRQQDPISEAQVCKVGLNAGQTVEEIARELGVSVTTVRNRLALLDLPVEVQKQIATGKLSVSKALQGPGESTNAGGSPNNERRPRRQSSKEVEAAMLEFAEDRLEYRILAWVLGYRESWK